MKYIKIIVHPYLIKNPINFFFNHMFYMITITILYYFKNFILNLLFPSKFTK